VQSADPPCNPPRSKYCDPLRVNNPEPLLPPSVVPDDQRISMYWFGALVESQRAKPTTVPWETFFKSPNHPRAKQFLGEILAHH
jgi:hypothetical protein